MIAPRSVALVALAALAACRPQARRLLAVDLAGGGPARTGPLVAPWRDAGYAAEVRRFFPHLARKDLERFHVVLVLGGSAPEAPSSLLTAGDLAVLDEWLARGGVVVLAYPPAPEGAQSRWLMNRWLASVGAGITIGPAPLADSGAARDAAVLPWAAPDEDGALFWSDAVRLPAGVNHALHVSDRAQVLARAVPAGRRTPGPPIVAARRVGDGLVIVASRSFLGALGPDDPPDAVPLAALADFDGTRRFLEALARWTRRPAEWASVPPAGRGVPLSLVGGPLAVPPTPPPLDAPPEAAAPDTAAAHRAPAALPPWLGRARARVLWAGMPGDTLPFAVRNRVVDSLLQLLDASGLDVVAGPSGVEAMAESTRYYPWERTVTAATWRLVTDRLGETSVRWIPAVDPGAFRLPRDTAVTPGCVLAPEFWDQSLVPAVRVLAHLAAANRDLIPAVALDLDAAGGVHPDAWCDADFRAGLDALAAQRVITRAQADSFAAAPRAARREALAAAGLLAPFFTALRRATAARAERVRADAQRVASGLGFVLRSRDALDDWFSLGLLDGWSAGGGRAALLSGDVRTGALAAAYLPDAPPVVAIPEFRAAREPQSQWSRIEAAYAPTGFWVTRIATDSQAHELRRFAR